MPKFLACIATSLGVAGALVPNDPYFSRQWHLHNTGTLQVGGKPLGKAGADIRMPEAWDLETGDSSIIVAILDTGCKLKHKNLQGRIWTNPGEIAGNGVDDDGNGFVDDVHGWNFNGGNADLEDSNGHGTAMAGLIGASSDDGIGYAGVDWKCKLMIVKVLPSEGPAGATPLAKGIHYAVDNGAKIINLSLGSLIGSQEEKAALEYANSKGVTICAAMGNVGADTADYPAAYGTPISVGSTDASDQWCRSFSVGPKGGSNFGNHLNIVAPGDLVLDLTIDNEDNYSHASSGTSTSTALVSGVAALLLAQDPSRTPDQVKQLILHNADDQVGDPTLDTPGWDPHYGWGRLNAFRALSAGRTQAIRSTYQKYWSKPPRAFTYGLGAPWERLDAPTLAVDARGRLIPTARSMGAGTYFARPFPQAP